MAVIRLFYVIYVIKVIIKAYKIYGSTQLLCHIAPLYLTLPPTWVGLQTPYKTY